MREYRNRNCTAQFSLQVKGEKETRNLNLNKGLKEKKEMAPQAKTNDKSSGVVRVQTAKGQIAHVNLRNHNSIWAWLFLASFFAVISLFDFQQNAVVVKHTPPPVASFAHAVFVLDTSGSMYGKPLRDVEKAVETLVSERVGSTSGRNDRASVVTFGSNANTIFQDRPIADAKLSQLQTSGSTSYAEGFKAALAILKTIPAHVNAQLVFMSDGAPTDRFAEWQGSVANIKRWVVDNNRSLNVWCIHFGTDSSGVAIVNDINSQLSGLYQKAVDGPALEATFKAIGSYSSYDDLALKALSTTASTIRIASVIPLFLAIAAFALYAFLLKYFIAPLLVVTFTAFPVLVCLFALVGAHQSELLSPNLELALAVVAIIVAGGSSYYFYRRSLVTATALGLGYNVMFSFPFIVPIQALLLVAWGIWAKFILNQVTNIDGGELQSVSLYFNKVVHSVLGDTSHGAFLSPWDVIVPQGSNRGFFLLSHLVVVTGVVFAINQLAVSRAAAALYFDFKAIYSDGSASLYHHVVTGALGTAVIAGLIRLAAVLVDRPLEAIERSLKTTATVVNTFKVQIGVTVGAGAPLLYAYLHFTSANGEDQVTMLSKITPHALKAVGTLILIALIPFLRKYLKKAIDSANFLVVVVAGVTGNSYVDSCFESLSLATTINTAQDLLATGSVAWNITWMANFLLSAFVVSTSILISKELNVYDVEAIALGSIVALTFLNIALDSLYTAVMASLACVLIQKKADANAAPGSDEALRKRGPYEIAALKLMGHPVPVFAPETVAQTADDQSPRAAARSRSRSTTPKRAGRAPSRSRSPASGKK